MRTLIYLFLLGSLLAGCASAGQTGIVQGGLAVTAAPAKAYPSALPDSTVPSPTAPDSEAALMAYDQSQKGYTLRKVNPATGEDVGGAPVRISSGDEYLPHLAYSADGSKLAAIESRGTSCEAFAGGVSCYPRAHAVQIIDIPTWQAVSTALSANGWVEALSFSPEAGKLAISYNHSKGSSVLVIDTASGEILSDLEIGFRPAGIAFYLDNRHLLVYGTLPAAEPGVTPPGALRVEAYLIPTGEKIWERELADVTSGSWCLENCTGEHGQQLYALWTPAILVSPQGDMLHILHADRNLLTRISLADGSRADVEVREAQSWLERLLAWSAGTALAKGGMEGATRLAAISADGKQLYVQTTTMKSEQNKDGFWAIVDETTELQAIDTHNGTILAQKPATGYGIRLTPDGKHLLFGTWTQSDVKTDVLSAKNLERVARLDGWEVAISPDTGGNLLLLGSRGTNTTTELTWIDPDSFQVQGSWKYKGQASWIPIR